MKILVCGGRTYDNKEEVYRILDDYLPIVETDLCLIVGGAKGADTLAKEWAIENGIPVMEFIANWQYYDKEAGPTRNRAMLYFGNPDLVIAFPGGRGTAHMVKIARAAGVEIYETNKT